MMSLVRPLVAPWGRFSLRSFFIDAPRPAIIDTGVAESPANMAAQLAEVGRDIADVRWVLLTHGHIDHLGGAAALHELTNGEATVVIHAADADFLRSREAHVAERHGGRGHFVAGDDEAHRAELREAISGEMEPGLEVTGGELLDLGDGVAVRVHAIGGHTPGAVAYEIVGHGDVFVGDAVQCYGAASGFPGYADADAYRASLAYLRDEVRPTRLYLGHPYRRADGTPFPEVLEGDDVREALQGSLENEARIRAAFFAHPAEITDSPYSPFEAVASALGYTGDPALEPSPFFTTMNAYVTLPRDENGSAS